MENRGWFKKGCKPNETSFKKGNIPYYKKEVPKGKVIIFLDGNNRNFEIDNLKIISRGALLILNRRYRHVLKDKELMRSCVDLSELIYALNKKKK